MGTFIKIITILFFITAFNLIGRSIGDVYSFDKFSCGWFSGLAAGYIASFITELKVTTNNNK